MQFSAAKFILVIEPYVLPVIVGVVSLAVGGVLIAFTIRQIIRQVKLHNSITLVELRSFKWHYYVFIGVIAFLIFFDITQMADPEAPELIRMDDMFGMTRWQSNIVLGALLGLMVFAEFFLVVLAYSKSAVVDKGVYCGMGFTDWYHVQDYIIDENSGRVILSSDKGTFSTLRGTTTPMRVAKNDVPKLKFILNKNKNKFSS